MPIIRLTRRGTIGPCNCKVGGCRKCGSMCRRCKCACDGISPLDALKRTVGKRRKKPQLMQDNEKHENEGSKKRNLDENKNVNKYTRKLRKRTVKQPRYNDAKQRKSTEESTHIAHTVTGETTFTSDVKTINAKGSKGSKGTIGYKDLRKIQCQVINNGGDLDASSTVCYSMQTDGNDSTTLSDDEKTTVNNDTKQKPVPEPEPEPTTAMQNAAEINNCARMLTRNTPVNTELIENLVIQTTGTGNLSINSKKSSSITTNQVTLPKLPSLPNFNSEDSNISNDEQSVISRITDCVYVQQDITTDTILDFFSFPEYMKKYIPSRNARETCQSLVNFKNQRFWYLHHCVKKIILTVTKTFVPSLALDAFVQMILNDIISSCSRARSDTMELIK